MAHTTLIGMLGSMLGRFVIGSCATVIATFSILLGALGATSEARAIIMFAWFVAFGSVAWVLLPAFRFGKTTAVAAGVVWLGCGVIAANFGVSSVRGYPLPSWVVASLVLLCFIALRPPKYLALLALHVGNGNENRRNDKNAP